MNLMRNSVAQQGCCARCRSTLRSSQACSRVTRSRAVVALICPPATSRPQPAIDYEVEVGEEDEDDDQERWLWVTSAGSRDGYRDMERFIGSLDDPDASEQLDRALVGRGAFRRFKDQLARWPELSDQWYAFSEDRQRGRARAWLAAEGYAPIARERRT